MNANSSSPSLPVRNHDVSESLGLWEPKRTLTLEAARKHTQRIQLLRKVLMGLAIILLCALVLQFFLGRSSTTFGPDNPTESVKMTNPRYSGRTADGLPFYLTADTATRTMDRRNEVDLIKPVLEFIRADGAESSFVLADAGTYDDVNKVLNLETAVTLETDDGYECETTHAQIFPREKRVEGDKPINCEGTFGSVSGQAYEINDNYREFVFKNNMSAVINQDPAQTPEVDPEATEVQNEFAFGGDGPINVKADRAVYIGGTTDLFDNVEVIQDGAIINAEEMKILRREATSEVDGTLRLGEVNKIIAQRDFRYRTTENDITGNQGVYERDKSLITVTGDVRVKQTSGNTARTDRLTYNTVSETIRFSGNCQGPGCGREGSTRVVISGNQ